MTVSNRVRRERRQRAKGRGLIAVVVMALAAALLVAISPGASAQKVANAGVFGMKIIGGGLTIGTAPATVTEFPLTPNPLPQCNDGKSNEPVGNTQDTAIDYPADAQCTSLLDDSETQNGLQPKQDITVTGTIDSVGNVNVPTSGVFFPPSYLLSGSDVITANIIPTAAATGVLNPNTGAANIAIRVRVALTGTVGGVSLTTSCTIGSAGSPILLNLTTGTATGPSPAVPLTGVPYNPTDGTFTGVNTDFNVIGASGCAFLGLANSSINTALGIPSTSGKNKATLIGQLTPIIGRGVNPVITGGTFRGDDERTIHFDGSTSTAIDGPIVSYAWDFGNGVTSTDPVVDVPYLTGDYTASLTVTDSVGDSSTTTVPIRVGPNHPPTAVITKNRLDGTRSLSMAFSGASSTAFDAPIVSYAWTFGDGGTSTEKSPVHVYGPSVPAGVKSVSLTVTDNDGVTSTATDTVTIINVNPVASFTMTPPTAGIIPQLVHVDASASTDADGGVASYAWDFGNGDTATGVIADYTYTVPGSYVVSLTVTDTDSGTHTVTKPISIAATNSPPVANAGPAQTNKKTGNTITLTAAGSSDVDGQPLTYLWTQTGGVPVTLSNATAVSPTFVVPPAPDFVYPHSPTFTVTVTDSLGASTESAPVSIQVTATTPTVTTPTKLSPATAYVGSSASPASTVRLTTTVTNPDGYPLTYTWAVTQDAANWPAVGLWDMTNPAQPVVGSTAVVRTTGNGLRATVKVTTSGPVPAVPLSSAVSSASSAFAVSLLTRPVANAGPDATVGGNSAVTLTGAGSTQAQGNTPLLTYAWSQTAGTPVTLSDATAKTPTFTAPLTASALTFSLVVTDPSNPTAGSGTNGKVSTADTVVITVTALAPPVADAGAAQTGKVVGDTVTLDGSASTQSSGGTLSYAWTQTGGPSVTLSDATAVSPTFVAPGGPASLTFELVVNDTFNSSVAASTSVSVLNSTPVADAGAAQSGKVVGDTVTLSGSGSDPDGNAVTYLWTQTGGPAVTLSDATVASPTFVAPGGPATLTFELVVNDGTASSAASVTTVDVDNGGPTADAGAAQTGKVVGDTVTLDGSGSSDPDGPVTYAWSQTGGPAVTLSDATAAQPTFVAPGGPASLTFDLVVSDGVLSDSASTSVSVDNSVPVASAGAAQFATTGDVVTLDGSASADPDGSSLTYLWTQTSGTAVTLSDATAAQPTFTAPAVDETLGFSLVVDDGTAPSAAATTTVTVEQLPNVLPTASASVAPLTGTAPLVVTFDASGSSDSDGTISTYAWAFGDGGTSTAVSGTHTYSVAGTFTATVTVTDNRGGTATASQTVVVDPAPNVAPTAVASVTPLSGTVPLTVTFNGSGSTDSDGTIASYAWDFGDGGTSTAVSGTHIYTTAGTRTVTLVVTDNQGATATATTSVTASAAANVAPTAVAAVLPTSGTVPLVISANGSGSSDPDGTIASYAWNFGDGGTATTVSASHTYNVVGTYTVTLTVTDNLGAVGTTTTTVVVDPVAVNGDRVKLQYGGALRYLYDGPTDTSTLKVTRDAAGIKSITGAATFPGNGAGSISITLTRNISGVNAYSGAITIRDTGLKTVTTQITLLPLYSVSATAVKGTASYYYTGAYPNLINNYQLQFTIDDRV